MSYMHLPIVRLIKGNQLTYGSYHTVYRARMQMSATASARQAGYCYCRARLKRRGNGAGQFRIMKIRKSDDLSELLCLTKAIIRVR